MLTWFFAGCFIEASLPTRMEADNFRLLQKNTASSPNIQCLQAALWHEEGEMEIHDRRKGNWSYSLVNMKRHSEATGQTTPCLTIPSLLQMVDGNRIDILKLDIEGAEKVVFDHAAEWIDRVEVIGVELHDRIAPGCTDAFRKAVSGFDIAQGGSEKWIAHQRGVKKESH